MRRKRVNIFCLIPSVYAEEIKAWTAKEIELVPYAHQQIALFNARMIAAKYILGAPQKITRGEKKSLLQLKHIRSKVYRKLIRSVDLHGVAKAVNWEGSYRLISDIPQIIHIPSIHVT